MAWVPFVVLVAAILVQTVTIVTLARRVTHLHYLLLALRQEHEKETERLRGRQDDIGMVLSDTTADMSLRLSEQKAQLETFGIRLYRLREASEATANADPKTRLIDLTE